MLSKADLTQGSITGTLLRFTLPMIIGSLLQQCYNIADTVIVGQCIGSGALAAVVSAYTLMVFLISILLGLSMGSGTVFFPAIWRRTDEGFTTKHLRIGRTHRNSDNRTEHSSSVFHSSHSQTITDSR